MILKLLQMLKECVVPENIHTFTIAGHWKFQGGGGGGGVIYGISRWEEGFKSINPLGGRYRIFYGTTQCTTLN